MLFASLSSEAVLEKSPVGNFEFRRNNFDLLRLLAATEVLFFHAKSHLDIDFPAWADKLWYFRGVPVFFVISGFLVSASFERSNDLFSYFRNRALRIFPGLWVCLLVTVLVASFFGFSFLSVSAAKWFFLQMFGGIYTPDFLKEFGFGSYNGSLWTIPVELQFYIVLPILYYFSRLTNISENAVLLFSFIFFSVVGFSISFLFPDMLTPSETRTAQLLKYAFFTHFYLFLAGVLLQRSISSLVPILVGKGLVWIALYVLFVSLMPKNQIFDCLSLLLLAVTVVSVAYTVPDVSARTLKGNDISYGVYIYHGLVLNILVGIGLVGRGSSLLLTLVLACAAAYVSWVFVERPFLQRKRQSLRSNLFSGDNLENAHRAD